MKKFVKLILFSGLFVMAVAFAQQSDTPVAKVSVLSSGKLLLNGEPTNLPGLDAAFQLLKTKDGTVWYYRQDAQAEPSAEAMSVVRLVVKYALPISMSTQPDFSDYVDNQGHAHAREP
jgi:hypothetical protein